MRSKAVLGGLAGLLLAAASASAQHVRSPLMPPPAQEPPLAARWSDPPLAPLAIILRQQALLDLSLAQVRGIERLALDVAREVIRRQADWQVAVLDAETMVDQDRADPANAPDLGRVESKIREIERIAGDLELTRLRAIEAAKAQLSAEQRAKLGRLLAGEDLSDPPDIIPAAARSGGAPGHSGGGRPGGGAPGHPGGHPGRPGHPGYGAPGHPGYGAPGHPGGGGHPPGWHGSRPQHWPYSHPGFHGGGFAGVWPYYWWGYRWPVYTAPPATLYWYYCPAYGAYYPDVPSCPEPWVVVPGG